MMFLSEVVLLLTVLLSGSGGDEVTCVFRRHSGPVVCVLVKSEDVCRKKGGIPLSLCPIRD